MIIEKLNQGYIVTTYGKTRAVENFEDIRTIMHDKVDAVMDELNRLKGDKFLLEVAISGKPVQKKN